MARMTTVAATTMATTTTTSATLSEIISQLEFQNAIDRLNKHPNEASVWVPVDVGTHGGSDDGDGADSENKDDGSCHQDPTERRRRRHHLPLHIACRMLIPSKASTSSTKPLLSSSCVRTEDSDENEKQQLPKKKKKENDVLNDDLVSLYYLIEQLVAVYPDACYEPDAGSDGSGDGHGRLLPLERVVIAHPRCPLRLLTVMLSANLEASFSPVFRRYVNIHDDERGALTNLLKRAQDAAIQSRQDARLRFLYNADTPDSKSIFDRRQCCGERKHINNEDNSTVDGYGNKITCKSSTHGEMESLVHDLYRHNDTYSKIVLELTKERLGTQNEIHRVRSIAREYKRELYHKKLELYNGLDDINSDLRKQIARMELILRDKELDCDGTTLIGSEASESATKREAKMSMMGMDPERPTPLTKYLENKVKELIKEIEDHKCQNNQLLARIEELSWMVANFGGRKSPSLGNSTVLDFDTPFSTPPRYIEPVSVPEPKEVDQEKEKQDDDLCAQEGDNTDDDFTDGMDLSRASSLGNKLKVVDKISRHETTADGEESVSTPWTAPSMAVSIAHSSVQNESESSLDIPEHPGREWRSGESLSRGENASLSSWGVLSMCRTPTGRSKRRRLKGRGSTESLHIEAGNDFHQSVENLAQCFADDNLDGILANAATIYHDFDGRVAGNKTSKDEAKAGKSTPRTPSNPLTETAHLLAASEEINDILDHAESSLGYRLNSGLVEILRNTALSMVQAANDQHPALKDTHDSGLGCQQVSYMIIDYSLVDAIALASGEALPREVVSSLRASAQWHIDHCRKELRSAEMMKQRLEEELLDALIETSQQMLKIVFPADLVVALRKAALSFDSFLIDEIDDANQHSISINFQVLDSMFRKAQQIYTSSFPQHLLVTLQEAGVVLQSILDRTESQTEAVSDQHSNADETEDDKPIPTVRETQMSPTTHVVTWMEDNAAADDDDECYDEPLQAYNEVKSSDTKVFRRKLPTSDDMSKASASEVSLDLFSVFGSNDASARASREDSSKAEAHTKKISIRDESQSNEQPKNNSGRRTGTRRSNSTDGALQIMASTLKLSAGLADTSHQSGYDDLELIFKHATESRTTSVSTSSPQDELALSSNFASAVEEGVFSLSSSTHLHQSDAVGAILESIIIDTEETYGIDIPHDLARAMKATIPQHVGGVVSLISVVKPLHSDSFWESTAKVLGKAIPKDLIAAFCLTFPSDRTQDKCTSSSSHLEASSCPSMKCTSDARSKNVQSLTLSPAHSTSMHSDNSWSKLTFSLLEPKTQSHAVITELLEEPDQNDESRHTVALSARERKRRAEAHLVNSLADFDFDFSVREIFRQAKETLEMYSPVNSGKRAIQKDAPSAEKSTFNAIINQNVECEGIPPPDNLDDLYKRSRLPSHRAPDVVSARTLSPPSPPDFSSMPKGTMTKKGLSSDDEAKKRSSYGPNDVRKTTTTAEDPCWGVPNDKDDDDLRRWYENASELNRAASDTYALDVIKSSTKPNANFKRTGFTSPKHTDKNLLSSFLELNRADMMERTQSGREILAISPVTEPTVGTEWGSVRMDEVKTRLRLFHEAIPDIEDVAEPATNANPSHFDFADAASTVLEDRSAVDTTTELGRVFCIVEEKYGTKLSNELMEAIVKGGSKADTSKLQALNCLNLSPDSVSSRSARITVDGALQSGNSSLDPLALALGIPKNDEGGQRSTNEWYQSSAPTQWTVESYLGALIQYAESCHEKPEQVKEITKKLSESVLALCARSKTTISWEELDSILQKLCDRHSEDNCFETQEAFFKAWKKCADPQLRKKMSRQGNASGYFSAASVSDGSISVLMNNSFDFDPLLDVIDEVKNLNDGRIPDFLLKTLKENNVVIGSSTREEANDDLQYSTDLSASTQSSMPMKLSNNEQSLNFDYSQSTLSSSRSSASQTKNKNSQSMDHSGSFSAWTRDEDTDQNDDDDNVVVVDDDDDDGQVGGQNLSTKETVPAAPTPSAIEQSQSLNSSLSNHSGHGVSFNRLLGLNLIREVRKIYTKPLPDALVLVLQKSVAIPHSMNSDEDVSIILDEIETSSGKQLPADLVLAIRDASVALRASSIPRRAKRSKLIKQSSVSSLRSAMPSIQESDSGTSLSLSSSQYIYEEDASSIEDVPALRRRDSGDPGLPDINLPETFEPAINSVWTNGGRKTSITRSTSAESKISVGVADDDSLSAYSDHSLNIPTVFANPSPQNTPTSSGELHESAATQLVSNTNLRPAPLVASDLTTVLSNSFDSSSIDHTLVSSKFDSSVLDNTTCSVSNALDVSSSYRADVSMGERGDATSSRQYESDVSCASTLPSKRLPIGVDVTPPVEGVESDDLDEIFRAAARRSSG